jgi:hypothetical protein
MRHSCVEVEGGLGLLNGNGMHGEGIERASGFFQFECEALARRVAILDFVGVFRSGIYVDAFLFIDEMDDEQTEDEAGEKNGEGHAREHCGNVGWVYGVRGRSSAWASKCGRVCSRFCFYKLHTETKKKKHRERRADEWTRGAGCGVRILTLYGWGCQCAMGEVKNIGGLIV